MIKCTLRLVIARENLKRLEQGQPTLTQPFIAEQTGLALSVVNGLITGRSQRVDFKTLDKLCTFLQVQPGEILVWEAREES
jgi:DNA-binding Xre family transcriptional regulator